MMLHSGSRNIGNACSSLPPPVSARERREVETERGQERVTRGDGAVLRQLGRQAARGPGSVARHWGSAQNEVQRAPRSTGLPEAFLPVDSGARSRAPCFVAARIESPEGSAGSWAGRCGAKKTSGRLSREVGST